jgi:uncharacterized tellurite resistance protein B-like protein
MPRVTQRDIAAEIGLCLLLSAVDGEISDKELAALSARVGHLLGDDFDVMRLPGLIEGELEAISAEGVDAYIARLPGRLPAARRYEAVRAACVVAGADGLAAEEEDVVRRVCEALALDAEDVLRAVTGPDDLLTVLEEAHDDAPDGTTALIAEHLIPLGFVDPMQAMRDAGVSLSGFGAIALQYPSPNGHLLRVEHHTCDGSIHLHVTDEADSGSDLVLFPAGAERVVIGLIADMRDVVTLENLQQWVDRLLPVTRVCIFRGDDLVELARPA